MIVQMNKFAFLVYHVNYREFLVNLKKIGVLHIIEKENEPSQQMQDLFRYIAEVERSVKKLEWLNPFATEIKKGSLSGENVFNRVKEIEKEIEHCQHKISHLEKEIKSIEPWGNFDWDLIKELQNKGLKFRFFTSDIKKYNQEWENEYFLKVIGELDGNIYFLKIEKADYGTNGFVELSDADEVILPKKSLNKLKDENISATKLLSELNKELTGLAHKGILEIRDYLNSLKSDLSEQNAIRQTSDEVEGKVKFIEGFVPVTKEADLLKYLEENDILFVSEKPSTEEKVPILLKNNKFAKLYEVIGDLYELPNHRELDLVPFFAPFYMMFFGFSLGDAGYGLTILLLTTIVKYKKPELRSIMTLAQWLGLATVIFGILTGTFFGIALIDSEISWLQNIKQYMVNTDQLFNLAIILGVIQILFGMILKVVNISKVQGFTYSISTIGWLVLLIGSGAIYGLKSIEAVQENILTISQNIVYGLSGIMILVMNHPKRNIFINLGAGLWDVYGMITSLLGDILSYIRLFALGVSSAILGLVFNSMAMSMKPDNVILGPIVMILILILGHSITLFMAALGAFVHPIRLTFVEFYKNAGFTGGGKPYKPFSEPVIKKI